LSPNCGARRRIYANKVRSIHDPISNLNNCPRHAMSSCDYRALRSEAIVVGREIAELGIAA
jgi:hypothetical protein